MILVGAGILLTVAVAMWNRATIPCGCFGSANSRPIGFRNALAGIAFVIIGAYVLAKPLDLGPPSLVPILIAAASLSVVTAKHINNYRLALRRIGRPNDMAI